MVLVDEVARRSKSVFKVVKSFTAAPARSTASRHARPVPGAREATAAPILVRKSRANLKVQRFRGSFYPVAFYQSCPLLLAVLDVGLNGKGGVA
jgi:hypothetical protein